MSKRTKIAMEIIEPDEKMLVPSKKQNRALVTIPEELVKENKKQKQEVGIGE